MRVIVSPGWVSPLTVRTRSTCDARRLGSRMTRPPSGAVGAGEGEGVGDGVGVGEGVGLGVGVGEGVGLGEGDRVGSAEWVGLRVGVEPAIKVGEVLGLAAGRPPRKLTTRIRTIAISAATPTNASQSRRGSDGGLARVRSDRRTTPV